jgi:hypothetical protein
MIKCAPRHPIGAAKGEALKAPGQAPNPPSTFSLRSRVPTRAGILDWKGLYYSPFSESYPIRRCTDDCEKRKCMGVETGQGGDARSETETIWSAALSVSVSVSVFGVASCSRSE